MSDEKKPSPRGLAATDPKTRQQIASAGGRASHENGGGHEWTPEEGRKIGSLGGAATRDKHPELHGQNGKLGGYSRGIRYLTEYERHLLCWLGAGKVAWQRTPEGPVWLSDQIGKTGDSRSFHAEAIRLVDRRLLTVQIDTTARVFHLTDGGTITARLLEKRKVP